jgi:hypothetical protein
MSQEKGSPQYQHKKCPHTLARKIFARIYINFSDLSTEKVGEKRLE